MCDCVSACGDTFTHNWIVNVIVHTNLRMSVYLISSKNDSKVIIILNTEQMLLIIRLVVAEIIGQILTSLQI
jgi:hypothetical protein